MVISIEKLYGDVRDVIETAGVYLPFGTKNICSFRRKSPECQGFSKYFFYFYFFLLKLQ